MPYIKQDKRAVLTDYCDCGTTPDNPGELNYIFTQIIIQYLMDKGESYQTYNDIVGALECCKLELYRRKIAWYEDNKIVENGDVY